MERELVSVFRDEIDDNGIQGFILEQSSELILLNYVYDFRLDGLMVIRIQDISEIKTSDTDKFQTQLLKEEGVFSQINFDVKYKLDSWKEFLESAGKKHEYFIFEEELSETPEFTIGTIAAIGLEKIKVKHFTGTARWIEDFETIEYSDLTCCQINSNYINVYERRFHKDDER